MRAKSRRRSWSPAALAALLCVSAAAHDSRARSDASGWTPALAALSDRAGAGSVAGAAPALAVPSGAAPLLVGAGMQATAATPEPPEIAQRTPEVAPRDETQRWVPGFAFTSGILGQGADGSVNSTSTLTYNYYGRQNGPLAFSNPPPPPPNGNADTNCNRMIPSVIQVTRFIGDSKATPPNAPNSPTDQGIFLSQPGTGANSACNKFIAFRQHENLLPAANNDLFLTPTVGGSFELMSPGLQDVPGRPRVFVHGDTTMAFAFDRNVAKVGTPTGAVIPTGPITPEVEIRGLGAKTSGEVTQWLFGAGVGPAFTFEAFERRLRVRTSFEWIREKIQVSGVVNKVFQVDTGQQSIPVGRDPIPGPIDGRPINPLINGVYTPQIVIRAEDTPTYNGIGPGLELEMDAARAGPVMLSLFLGGQAYKMLGDLGVHLHGETTVPRQVGANGEVYVAEDQTVGADFDFSIHSWAYRGGMGLRFRWLPED